MVIEKEYCTTCKVSVDHEVDYKKMSDGRDMRSGKCSKCGHARALPLFDGPPEDQKIFFGKHKGKALKEVPVDYLTWLLTTDLNHSMRKRIEATVEKLGSQPTKEVVDNKDQLSKYEKLKKTIVELNLSPIQHEALLKYSAKVLGI